MYEGRRGYSDSHRPTQSSVLMFSRVQNESCRWRRQQRRAGFEDKTRLKQSSERYQSADQERRSERRRPTDDESDDVLERRRRRLSECVCRSSKCMQARPAAWPPSLLTRSSRIPDYCRSAMRMARVKCSGSGVVVGGGGGGGRAIEDDDDDEDEGGFKAGSKARLS